MKRNHEHFSQKVNCNSKFIEGKKRIVRANERISLVGGSLRNTPPTR